MHYKIKDVLNLRLVSLECYQLVSSINSYFTDLYSKNQILSLLAYKVSIPFSFNNLHPSIEASLQEKFAFAKNNTQVKVTISVDELINESSNLSSILHSIPDNHLNLLLPIKDTSEVNKLSTLILNPVNTQFINKIIAIDFSAIDITAETMNPINTLLITLSQSSKLLPKLTGLSFGNIGLNRENNSAVILRIPEQLNSLSSFECGEIHKSAILTFPKELNSLSSFKCEYIKGTLALPEELNSLRSFVCGEIQEGATITCPEQLCWALSIQPSKNLNIPSRPPLL